MLGRRRPGTTPHASQHPTKEPAGIPTGGTAVADFRVLVSHRVKDRDEQWIDAEPTGHNVRVYGRMAEAVVDQLVKCSRVIVVGRTETDAWGDPETGEKRTTTRVIVDRHGAIGRALNPATATTDTDDSRDPDESDGSGEGRSAANWSAFSTRIQPWLRCRSGVANSAFAGVSCR